MIEITVLPTSSVPAYRQIAESISAGVIAGRIPPGTALPPIRTVAAQLGVSVITVRTAWELLEKEGFIITKAGSGCFAAELTPENAERAKLKRLKEHVQKLVSTAKMIGCTADETAELVKAEFLEQKQ